MLQTMEDTPALTDKKALMAKVFIGNRGDTPGRSRELALCAGASKSPGPQHQRGYEIEKTDLLRDAVEFVFPYLLRLRGAPPHLDAGRKS